MTTATTTPSSGSIFGGVWWRHVLAWVAIVWALFPISTIASAAVNPAGSLSTSSLLPNAFSGRTSRRCSRRPPGPTCPGTRTCCMWRSSARWQPCSIGACSAYVFSRMRFKGRRAGLMTLLLLQMFPALLAFVAVYATFDQIGQVLPAIGLDTTSGLILAYLGGAMGANVWLLKGYFDTVPKELDEAAKIDGASHARVFFTIVPPLVMPILVTVFMLSFVGLFSEFMLASIFLRDVNAQTLGVGQGRCRRPTRTPTSDILRRRAARLPPRGCDLPRPAEAADRWPDERLGQVSDYSLPDRGKDLSERGIDRVVQ